MSASLSPPREDEGFTHILRCTEGSEDPTLGGGGGGGSSGGGGGGGGGGGSFSRSGAVARVLELAQLNSG